MKIIVTLSGRSPSSDPMLLLNIEDHYYLINCSDGAERIFLDSSYSIPRLEYVFVTSCQSSSVSGLFAITIAFEASKAAQDKVLGIIGPKKQLLDMYENSSYCHNFSVSKPVIEDQFCDDFIFARKVELNDSVCFFIKMKDEPGHFLPNKAKQLGVKPGPDFKKLTNGEPIFLPNGKTVTLNDCISEPIIGESLLIVDCKTKEDVVKLNKFLQDMKTENPTNKLNFFVHLTKFEILNSDGYKNCFQDYKSSETVHITFPRSNENNMLISSLNSYQKIAEQIGKNNLQPITPFSENTFESQEISKIFGSDSIGMKSGDSYVISPIKKKGLIPDPQQQKANQKSLTNDGNSNTNNNNNNNNNTNIDNNYDISNIESFAITFLGTGAKKLTITRGTAGILVHTKLGFIVLDAGEGFTFQLYRKFGEEVGDFIVRNIIAVWISHQHIDHYFGLHKLLDKRRELITTNISNNTLEFQSKDKDDLRIPLICDRDLIKEAQSYERNNFFNGDSSIHCDDLLVKYCDFDHEENKVIALKGNRNVYNANDSTLHSVELRSVEVMHMNYSKGVLLTVDGERRIGYSGDRSLEDNFVEEVGEVDLLIHEATFMRDFVEAMHKKRHSTIEGAIDTGKKMKAKFVALTHISNRYDKMYIESGEENVLFAFDLLHFRFEDLENLIPLIKKAQKSVFQPLEKE